MRTLKWIALGVGLVVVVFLLVGFSLPRKFHVERSVVIDAPPAQVHPAVNRLKEWPTWTAWTVERFPDMKVSFAGPEEGVGARYEWEGESIGQGELEIKTSDPAKGVTYEMAFNHGAMPSTGGLTCASEGRGTKVTWYANGDLGFSPIGRFFGLSMDSMMGPDFQTGLSNLKKKVESGNASPPNRDNSGVLSPPA